MYKSLFSQNGFSKSLLFLFLLGCCFWIEINLSSNSPLSIPFSLFNSGVGLTNGSPDTNPLGGSFSDDALRLRLPNSRPLSAEKTEQARIILIQGGLSPMEADMVLEESTEIPEDSV